MNLVATLVIAALGQQRVGIPDDRVIESRVVHVALDGDDRWSGLAERSDGRGEGPLRTLPRALAKARELRSGDAKAREHGVVIVLGAGSWFLDAPIVLGPEDSGSEGKPLAIVGKGIVTHPEGLGMPGIAWPTTLSGGRPISGWRRERLRDLEVWVADVPDLDGKPWAFRELFVGGQRRTRARHPDRGYLALAGVADADGGKPWNEGVPAVRVAPADVAPLRDGGPADLTLMSRWVESHCRIASIDGERGLLALRDKTVFKPDPGDLYYVESLAALDQPGEWWLDEKAKRLCYAPLPGEDPATTEVVAPRLTQLLTIAGDDDPKRRVHDVLISFLRFEDAEWWYPTPSDPTAARSSGAVQAAFDVPAAIELRNARDVRIRISSVAHCGTYGIALGRGCERVTIDACSLSDLGGGGIKIGEPSIPAAEAVTKNNRIRGCDLRDLGRLFHSAVGIWIGQSPDNEITQNTIADLGYTGISIGWTWGYGPASAGGNRVTDNDVGFVGRRSDGDGPILSDMGAIYSLGTQEGTVISHNYFHDVAALRYGGWGIYFDEGSTHLHASGNLVLRTTHGGFHQHYGKENRVDHNLFGFGRDAQIQRSRPEEHVSFTFDHNVVLCRGGELFAGDLRDGHFDLHDNAWLASDPAALRFAGATFDAWQAAKRDLGSFTAALEPAFENPAPERSSANLPDRTALDPDPVPALFAGVELAWYWPAASPIWRALGDERPGTRALSIQRDDR